MSNQSPRPAFRWGMTMGVQSGLLKESRATECINDTGQNGDVGSGTEEAARAESFPSKRFRRRSGSLHSRRPGGFVTPDGI